MSEFASSIVGASTKTWDEVSSLLPDAAPMWDCMWVALGMDPPEVELRLRNVLHTFDLVSRGRDAGGQQHETALIRQVLAAVPEYEADGAPAFKNMRVNSKRRPHDVVLTEAVHATLSALGITIRPDGSLEKP